MLFVELALIRWTAANNVYVTNATNFVLLASFLGIGLGFLNAKSNRDFVRWAPLAMVLLVAFVLAFPVILATLAGPHPYQGLFGTQALPRPVSLAVIFVLSTAVMAGFGQAVARLFVTFEPLKAYRLDIFGSILGTAVFTLLAFLELPPVAWGVIAAGGLVLLLGRSARWWQYAAAVPWWSCWPSSRRSRTSSGPRTTRSPRWSAARRTPRCTCRPTTSPTRRPAR